MIKKLRRKFICINMLIIALILIGILLLTVNMTRHSLEEDSLDTLRASYTPEKKDQHPEVGKEEKSQKPGSGEGSGNDEGKGAKKDQKGQKEARLPTFTLTYAEDGTLIAEGSDFYDLADTEYLADVMEEARGRGTEYGVLWHHSLRFLRNNGKGNSYSFMDISSEISTLWTLLLNSMIIGVLAFGGFLILSIFLARWATRPAEKAWNQQQQFVADASHELKTPLTVIITGAELLENPELPEATRKQCVDNILETSQRMRSLTEEMLNLARADHVQKELLQESCDLSDLLEDSVMTFEPLFFERGLELEAQIDPGITVKGNQTQLRQLGELLLDNGQKYSLPGKTILTLKKQGFRSCELVVSNPASPMSEEELEKLFERFYRADPVRTASGSYGLGLAIARGIVQRHGGTIQAEQKEDRIFFTVKLPIA